MFMIGLTVLFFALGLSSRRIVAATDDSIVAPFNVTDNVFELTVRQTKGRWKPLPALSQDYLISIHQNRFYLANVMIGGYFVNLAIDTSSQTTWVASSKFTCLDPYNGIQPNLPCNLERRFNPTKSTFQSTVQRVKHYYTGGQFIEGKVIQEELRLGGLNSKRMPSFTINHNISLAEKGYWEGDGISAGVLGLAFPRQPDDSSVLKTLFYGPDRPMGPDGEPIPPIVSLALNRYSPSFPTVGGLLAFGGVPKIRTQNRWGKAHILDPVLGSSAPRIKVDGFRVRPPNRERQLPFEYGPSRPGLFTNYAQTMEVVSGTPMVHVPAEVVEYTASLFDQGAEYDTNKNLYYMRCDAKAPSFAIRISRRPYYISEEDLITPAPEYGQDYCKLQLQPVSGGRFILGDAWLRNVLIVFDYSPILHKWTNGNGMIRVDGRELIDEELKDKELEDEELDEELEDEELDEELEDEESKDNGRKLMDEG